VLLTSLATTLGCCALLPGTAAADGPVAPTATNYLARVIDVPAGLEAKVVNAYLNLWVQVPPHAEVTILDFRGAPWVRFTPAGVAINRNSQEYYLSQVPVPAVPPKGLTRTTPPHWIRVSSGHAYVWREGRLHALATIALAPGQHYVGSWRIPVLVNGRAGTIVGAMWHQGAPSIVWFWPVLVLLACALAAWRLRLPELDRRVSLRLALVLLTLVAVGMGGKYLHGSPSVTAGNIALLLVTLGRAAAARHGGDRTVGRGDVATGADPRLRARRAADVPRARSRRGVTRRGVEPRAVRGADARHTSVRRASALLLVPLLVVGCGSTATVRRGIPRSLLAGVRPIGRGLRFQPPVTGHIAGACSAPLGRRLQAHIELFGANRVVLLATGIGTRTPRQIRDGRLTSARCFGELVTLDPTGTVYFRPGRRLTVGDLFSAWGQRLGRDRIASFAEGPVRVYVNGQSVSLPPRAVPLTQGAEIVLETGPRVPPHRHFSFPAAPSPELR
jgi:hypothetical protein